MNVSKGLRQLAEYVTESEGDERTYALCVFTDCALKEGTKDAERYCAEVLSRHLCETPSYEDDELFEAKTKSRKVTVDQLIDVVTRLDRSLDRELVKRVAMNALRQLKAETDDSIRARITKLLVSLGVPPLKIHSAELAIFAFATVATSLSQAA